MSNKNTSADMTNDQDGEILAPWERTFETVTTPFEEFIHSQTSSGIILMVVTAVALFVANSPLLEAYQHLSHAPIGISIGAWRLEMSLHHWVNDALMSLFFFLVGLEIKREILVGELASARKAALPILAAIGGMVVPAVIYYLFNPEGAAARGWGVPMATDIAFAVGVLVLLGNRIPKGLIMFLVALAIVDDLGAVLVIALFYTENIALNALAVAGGLLVLLVVFNLAGVRKPVPYFLVGGLLWLAMLESGIHATVAGVLVAFTIPARPRYDAMRFSRCMRNLLDRFDASHKPGAGIMQNEAQRAIAQTIENSVHRVETPLQRLEHAFHLPVGILVVPIFALFNAGIPLSGSGLGDLLAEPIMLGVMAGLVLGKLIGIAGTSLLAVRLGWASLPQGVSLPHIVGVGLLGGVGFTMSIFIAELGFAGLPEELLMAKTGILLASLAAAVGGLLWLLWVTRVPARG